MRIRTAAFAVYMLFATADAQAGVSIVVDKNNQTMTVEVDGVERYQWPVSTGRPSHETPNGQFRAFRIEEDHYSKEFDEAPMPHSIFFTRSGHAIHGTDSVDRLGSPASHGCVRLSRENAATLFALVQSEGVLNTTVALSGSSKAALANNLQPSRAASAGREVPSAGDVAGNPAEQSERTVSAVGQQTRPQSATDGFTEAVGRRPAKQGEVVAGDRRRAADARTRASPGASLPGSQSRGFFSFMD